MKYDSSLEIINTLTRKTMPRRIFITGGASGLGLALAREFIAAGWTAGLFDFRPEALANVKASLTAFSGHVFYYEGDVRDPDSLSAAIDKFAANGLGIMINNAGVAAGGDFLQRPLEDWKWVMDINLMGTVHGCRAAIPHLLKHDGILHNVASAAGFMSAPMMASYNASKAAVVALTESLIAEFSEQKGLTISVSLPAFFKTDLLNRLEASEAEADIARLLTEHSGYTVEQACQDILFGLAHQKHYIFAPQKLKTLWRWKRFFPSHYLSKFPALRYKRIEKLKNLA